MINLKHNKKGGERYYEKDHVVWIISVLIGLWLIMFQVPNISYGAPEPYVSTGFPRVVVVSGSNYDMGVQYGEQAAAA